jgi:DNA-binding MarR family transcriptional regulator
MMAMDTPIPSPRSFAHCVCLGVNKAARGTTRRYDAAFKPFGLTSGQFSLLAALHRPRPIALGKLAEVLGMDRTTLNRNIKPLEDEGLVATVADPDDARVRALALTALGLRKLAEAAPVWQALQADAKARVSGPGDGAGWETIRQQLLSLT